MLNELLTSEEFKRYQLKLAEEMSGVIVGILNTEHPELAKGAIDMAKRVMSFPMRLNKDSDVIKFKHKEVMDRFQKSFLNDTE